MADLFDRPTLFARAPVHSNERRLDYATFLRTYGLADSEVARRAYSEVLHFHEYAHAATVVRRAASTTRPLLPRPTMGSLSTTTTAALGAYDDPREEEEESPGLD